MRRVIALMALVAVGLGLFLYPSAVAWNQARISANRLILAASANSSATDIPSNDLVVAAQEYNAELTRGPARYFDAALAGADQQYQSQLRAPNSDLMGEVVVPKIDVRVPLYHGTSDEVLQRGAGHVYGSSLPVGGPSTHTVISAHAGLAELPMFTDLNQLAIGDEFFILTTGQTLRYVVDQVQVVWPSQTDALRVIPGEDHATLLTCTPIGINSHRLLVRGTRASLAETTPELAAAPFPSWALWYGGGIGGSGLFAGLVDAGAKRRYRTRRPQTRPKMQARGRHRGRRRPMGMASGRLGTSRTRPTHAVALLLAMLITLGALVPLQTARAMDLPSPLPTPLPAASSTGTLTVQKHVPTGKTPSATEFVATPITAINNQPIDLANPATWAQLATFEPRDIAAATLGSPVVQATNATGEATFQLPDGLYYVTETTDQSKIGDPSVTVEPFLVTLPFPDTQGNWQNIITAEPKVTTSPSPSPTVTVTVTTRSSITTRTATVTASPQATDTSSGVRAPAPTAAGAERGSLHFSGADATVLFTVIALVAGGLIAARRKEARNAA